MDLSMASFKVKKHSKDHLFLQDHEKKYIYILYIYNIYIYTHTYIYITKCTMPHHIKFIN